MRRAGRALMAALAVTLGLVAPVASAQEHDGTGMDHSGGMTVGNGRTEMPASHLQAMIDAVPPGGVLSVSRAVFVGTIILDEPITLEGIGRPVIDGAGEASVVTISASDVTIRGFAIRGSGPGPIGSPSGVMIEDADRAHVEDVAISDSYIGITVRSSPDVVIDHLRISGRPVGPIEGENHALSTPDEAGGDHDGMRGTTTPIVGAATLRGDGIWLWNATSPVVRDTSIADVRDGIYVSYGTGALIERTTIERSRYAIHDMYGADLMVRGSTLRGNLSGCVLMYGGPVVITGNAILDNGSPSTGFGVLVKDAGDVTVAGNVIVDNRIGIQVDDAGRTGGESARVEANTLAMNQVGVVLYPSTDATFVHNAFVQNATQVILGGQGDTQVVWSSGGVGNYWSDYGGFDADADGIGDLAYRDSGNISRLLAREPLLIALASGPGFRLLSAVDDRWSSSEPLVVDRAPLIEPPRPGLGLLDGASTPPLSLAGAALVALAAWSLVRARRPRSVGGRIHA